MRMMLCAILVLGGCGTWMRGQARVGAVSTEATARGGVEQSGGRDVFNVSPTVAVSGGGGIVLIVGAMVVGRLSRTRRALRAVVSGIEETDGEIGREVKRRVSRSALAAGVGDYLHGVVKRETPSRGGRRYQTFSGFRMGSEK